MSYFSDWNKEIEKVAAQGHSNAFVEDYYRLEREAYDQLLKDPKTVLSGTFAELQEKLGFGKQPLIFAGFLEGINDSLKTKLDLDSLVDDSPVTLDVDFEKLLYNMHDAKASWLYELESWENVFSEEERAAIGKRYRTEHIAVSQKVGRNDPCPCGSGKKYKACCGKNPVLTDI